MQKNSEDLYRATTSQALKWTTACEGGACVMVADLDNGAIAMRDSKLGEDSPILAFTAAEMRDILPELIKKYGQ